MYKALDIRDNTEIVILDSKWLIAINQLDEYDRQDLLSAFCVKQSKNTQKTPFPPEKLRVLSSLVFTHWVKEKGG